MSGRYGMANPYVGDFGTAARLEVPRADPRASESLDAWLLTTPIWNPAWSQFLLTCVRLRDTPRTRAAGLAAPHLQFDGATHELAVTTIDATEKSLVGKVFTREELEARMMADEGLPLLKGANVVEQFTATDEEMTRLEALMAKAVVDGILRPETSKRRVTPGVPVSLSGGLGGGSPQETRELWRATGLRTLAHFREEEHA